MENKLAGKLVEIMEELDRIPKNGFNKSQNYAYVRETDVEDALRKLLVKHRIVAFPRVFDVRTELPLEDSKQRLTTIRMDVTFEDAETGETRTVTVAGQGTDALDKGIYKAITGATKYFTLKTFHLPTGDDPEADESGEREVSRPVSRRGTYGKSKSMDKRLEAQGVPRAEIPTDLPGNPPPISTEKLGAYTATDDDLPEDLVPLTQEKAKPFIRKVQAHAKTLGPNGMDAIKQFILDTTGKTESKNLTKPEWERIVEALPTITVVAGATA